MANAVGARIKPRSLHPDPAVRDRLHDLRRRWTDRADASGITDFYGLQALALRAMVESGESFARLRTVDGSAGLPPLAINLLDREQVPADLHREIGDGRRVRAGIEFDMGGRRIAYHAYSRRPGDALAPIALDTIRVPAADIAHLFQPLAAGQLRGVTWLAPILLRLHELDQYEDAALVKAKVAALFTGFIRDPDGTVAGLNDGSASGGVLQVGMEPGSLIPLPPGADIQFFEPADPGDYGAFVKNHIRAVASGLGVPYELVSGDLEGVTYSSIRAGLVEFRHRIEQLQHSVIVFQFCRPVWERFVRLAVLSGALDARGFKRDAYATCAKMARELLMLRGHTVTGVSPATLITRALHTTSDFPIIVGDTIGRTLRAAYSAAPVGIRRLGRQTTARDFRAVNKVMLGEAPALEKIVEHGSIRAGTMAEAREAYRVETFAKKIGITRQVLVNLLESGSGNGPTMSDAKALFHVDHGNRAATGAVIADTTLSAARLAMRSQTGISGLRISATPKYLLVPPAQETAAEKWLASIAAAKASDVNPFSGSLTLVVEPRLGSAIRWYITADPSEIDGLEYAYLAGGEGPQIESRAGWDVDGVELRVILDFGAGFIDWRGWYVNPGA